jgi:hypothetical protein
MGALALHPRPQAAVVYRGLAVADESVVLAAGHWGVHEKHRAADRDFLSAADRDFQWAVAAPLVEQGDELPERPAQQRPAVLPRVVCLEPQLPVEVARMGAAREQPPDEWVSPRPQVLEASRLQGHQPAQEPVPWEQFSVPQGQQQQRPEQEPQGPLALLPVGQVRLEQAASPRPENSGGLAGEPLLRPASYAQPSRQLPSLLSPLWPQLPPELLLLRPLEFSYGPFPQRRPESNWSGSSSP